MSPLLTVQVCALIVAPEPICEGVQLEEPRAKVFLGTADEDVEHLEG